MSRRTTLLAAALLLAASACTSGHKHAQSSGTAATSTTDGAAGLASLQLALQASALGPGRGFDAKAAARSATPGMQRFLTRYLGTAYFDPGQPQHGWRDLLGLFDTPVQASARHDLDALSLGADAAKVKSVRAGPSSAKVLFLFKGGRPVAATVWLAFNGSADTGQASGPVHLHAVLQLLDTTKGWAIESYDSHTGGAS